MPGIAMHAAVVSDSCFLLPKYTQLLYSRRGYCCRGAIIRGHVEEK